MTSLLQDLRFGLRLFAKAPGFTVAAIAVLALGIGLNTAVFSLTYSLAFSPRPFPEPERIVQLYTHDRKEPANYRAFSYPLYREIAARSDLFSGVLAHALSIVGVGEKGETRRSFSALVSSNYFDALGVRLLQGRPFTPAEERPGSAGAVTIVSYEYWRKTGFNPALVGSTLRINERPCTVIGIAPRGFSGTMMLVGPELYFPLGMFDLLSDDFEGRAKRTLERADTFNLFLVARLAPGVTREAATSALGALGTALEKDFPVEFKDKTVGLGSLPRLSTSTAPSEEKSVRLVGFLLLGMAGAMLLVVCLNLAGLLLARGNARRKEFAIRLALGGGRARLVRQLLVEGLVLTLGGGSIGVLLAGYVNGLVAQTLNTRLPITLFLADGVTPVIVAATAAFCLLATLFFALGPALKFARTDVLTDLKGNSGEDATARHRRWLPRHPLVVAQIALSLALLVASVLFMRMALGLATVENGYHAEHTLMVEVDAALGGFNEAQTRDLYRAVQDRLAALPGVAQSSLGSIAPFGFTSISRPVRRAGINPGPDAKPATAAEGLAFDPAWNSVGVGYFAAMGLPILRGRDFTRAETDAPGSPLVAIIDEELARRLWPDGDALGQRLQWADRDAPRANASSGGGIGDSQELSVRPGEAKIVEIVGIVRSTRDDIGQKTAGPALYVPFAQGHRNNVFFYVRSNANTREAALALLDPTRRAVREAAPGLPMFKVQTFSDHLASNIEIWLSQFSSALFGFFSLVAMIVSVVGIYGVKSYSVSRRTREIGVRMALGAQPREVRAMILRESAVIAGSGIAIGLLLSLAVGQAMAAVFTDVPAFDLWVFSGAALAFAIASLAACWSPAVRATRVNPLEALRAE